ncbi:hypothetical protein [Haloferax sp. ATB1]|uniref:hypothetical protein n=1 Tax=Haloferax sp. ATB1 TaxID=1508454 RepID=UPI001F520D60|nr:hypothetical protein [Haloferax sp. ATB1]
MTPPTPGTNNPYREEEPYADALLRGIELAVEDVFDGPGRNITRTEQEKLCYFAIKEFDLPVTYSWYLAGAYTKVAGEPDNAPGRMTTNTGGVRRDHGETEEVQQYRDYFASEVFFDDYDLRKVWYTGKFDFLRDFYQECAPDEYTDLYLTSTDIREHLETLDETIEQETTNHSLSDFGGGSQEGLLSESDERKFRLLISDLHLELAEIDELSEIVDLVTRGTDVIEQVFAQLTTLESISSEQETVLQDLAPYFYYDVWRYPALYISTQTAKGPNRHHLIEEHADRFTSFHEDLLSRRNRLSERCADADLYPRAGHHSQRVDEEQMAHLHEMAREVLEGTE